MMQLVCMGAARQCPPTGPQGKYQLVASSLSTLVLLLTRGDGSFTALKKLQTWNENISIWTYYYVFILKNYVS